MQFLYPSFLFALFALAIPVIIHLFNFRRYKKIYFTNVRFLTDLQQEQKSRNRLRHLLLLLLRMLAIASIVIAFAHPFVPQKNKLLNPGKKYVSVYIDNSFSMNNVGTVGELLQTAKKHASEIASGYKEGDGYNLVTNDFELKHQHWVNRADFVKLVNDVNISPAFRNVSEVAERMKENFRKAETGTREAYLISDFQQNMADLDKLKPDSSVHFNFVPLEASTRNNVYVDSVWFDAPLWQLNQKNTLFVKVVNSGSEKISDHTLNMSINGKAKALANFSIPEQGSAIVPLVYTVTDEGANKGVVSLDDYPIVFDNQFYFTYNVTRTLPVLIISGAGSGNTANIAFSQEKSFELTNVLDGNVDYSALDKYNFIILNELQEISNGLAGNLKTYMQKSGNVLVVPPAKDVNLESYGNFLSTCSAERLDGANTTAVGVAGLDKENPFFKSVYEDLPRNVTMPLVMKYYKTQKTANSKTRGLLNLSNGDPMLTMVPQGKGYLFVSAIPYNNDWSNYSHSWLFLPALYKMAFFHNKEEPLSYTIDRDNVVNVPSMTGDEKKVFSLVKDNSEFIPNQKMLEGSLQLFVEGLIHTAGYYTLKDNQKNVQMQKQYVYAYNYNRRESVMKFLQGSDMKDRVSALDATVINPGKVSLKKQVSELESGINLWKWFIWSALVFLLCETIVTRFWK
jgi:hypothetical protein